MGRPNVGETVVTKEQNKTNTEKQQVTKEELKKYNERYKNILWIDDDCGDNPEGNLKWLKETETDGNKNMLEDLNECYNIKTVKYFSDAVKEINKNNYDLVIFDINLENSFKLSDNAEDIESSFREQHINFEYNKFIGNSEENESNRKIAGEYLYLLLLSKGYPQNRMIIYTNNSSGFQGNSKLSQAKIFDFSDKNKLFISKNNSINIDEYFNGTDNEYYRVRRLVYQACDYWERKLEGMEEIPFNLIYSLDYEKQSFIDMLQQIKMMFSVIKPGNTKEVYYQAMHIVSMFHEEKAKIEKINNKQNIFPYHQMTRNFRNWSSHNKFETHDNFSADQFAFLFCVALRTYFDTQKHENKKTIQYEYYLNKDIHYYENVYFTNLKEIDWNEADKKINHIWKKAISEEVEFYGGRTNKEYLLKNIDFPTLLQRLGEQEFKIPFCYINTLMFKSPVEYDKKSVPIQTEVKNGNDGITVTFNYRAKIVNVNKSKFAEENAANKFFEKIAFDIVLKSVDTILDT